MRSRFDRSGALQLDHFRRWYRVCAAEEQASHKDVPQNLDAELRIVDL
jgi:hypothetical protein